MTTEPEELDLRGKPKSVQLKESLAMVTRAAAGITVCLLVDEEIVIKALPLAAQNKGIKIKLGMPSENLWRVSLIPQGTKN
jgi:hypothetical protein